MLKEWRRKLPFYWRFKNASFNKRQQRKLAEWEAAGHPVPPPHIVKQNTLKAYATEFGLKVLVETGTYHGDMVEAMKPHFERIYSIELSREFFEGAKERFKSDKHVELLCGDSGHELASLVKRLSGPALFWLDGHYSAGHTALGENITPIFLELQHILETKKPHVVVIDDARLFGTHSGYPAFDEVKQFVLSLDPAREITVADDSIRITPRRQQL